MPWYSAVGAGLKGLNTGIRTSNEEYRKNEEALKQQMLMEQLRQETDFKAQSQPLEVAGLQQGLEKGKLGMAETQTTIDANRFKLAEDMKMSQDKLKEATAKGDKATADAVTAQLDAQAAQAGQLGKLKMAELGNKAAMNPALPGVVEKDLLAKSGENTLKAEHVRNEMRNDSARTGIAGGHLALAQQTEQDRVADRLAKLTADKNKTSPQTLLATKAFYKSVEDVKTRDEADMHIAIARASGVDPEAVASFERSSSYLPLKAEYDKSKTKPERDSVEHVAEVNAIKTLGVKQGWPLEKIQQELLAVDEKYNKGNSQPSGLSAERSANRVDNIRLKYGLNGGKR